jgi:hypothetical protein
MAASEFSLLSVSAGHVACLDITGSQKKSGRPMASRYASTHSMVNGKWLMVNG